MEHIGSKSTYIELGAVFKELEAQLDTPAHQENIDALTLSLTVNDMVRKHSCNRIAALGIRYHEVFFLNERSIKVKRENGFKTQTLEKIVEPYEWSRTTEEKVMQDKLSYDDLYKKCLNHLLFRNTNSLGID